MGDVSSSYSDELVPELVEDEACGCGDETGNHDFDASRTEDDPDKALVSNGNREDCPGDDYGSDFSSIEL